EFGIGTRPLEIAKSAAGAVSAPKERARSHCLRNRSEHWLRVQVAGLTHPLARTFLRAEVITALRYPRFRAQNLPRGFCIDGVLQQRSAIEFIAKMGTV